MSTYSSLDLNALYNAGLDVLGGQESLGSDAKRCLIAGGGGRSGVEIPVGRRATWMIVAHRLLESRIADNGPLATLVAEYALHPFNLIAILHLALPGRGRVELTLYNMAGQRVCPLVDRTLEAGYHTLLLGRTRRAGLPDTFGRVSVPGEGKKTGRGEKNGPRAMTRASRAV